MKNTLPTNKSWRRRGKVQKTGQLKVRPERLGHNGLASCRKSGGQVGRGTTCCLPTCVRSLSTTLQSAKNTKLNYRDRDWAIGPLVANGLWNEINMLAQYYSPSPWYSRDAEYVFFLHFLYLIVVVTIVVTGVATAMIDLWQIFSHQLFLQRTTRSFWLVEVSLTCWCMVLDIALLSKNCHMVGPDHPNKIFLGNHLTETERGDWVANHLLLVEDQVHCHLLMSSLHLTSLPPPLTWAQPSQGLALPDMCLRHRRKQGRPWRTSMAKISLVLTLLATLGSSPNRPLLPPEPPAGLRRHQLLHGGAGLQAPDEPF